MWLRDSSSTGSAMKTFHITQQQLALITQLPKDKQCQPRNSANVLPWQQKLGTHFLFLI